MWRRINDWLDDTFFLNKDPRYLFRDSDRNDMSSTFWYKKLKHDYPNRNPGTGPGCSETAVSYLAMYKQEWAADQIKEGKRYVVKYSGNWYNTVLQDSSIERPDLVKLVYCSFWGWPLAGVPPIVTKKSDLHQYTQGIAFAPNNFPQVMLKNNRWTD